MLACASKLSNAICRMRDPIELEFDSALPPARAEDFKRFALQFGIAIPEELQRILQRFNGGTLDLCDFLPAGRDDDDSIDIVAFFHIGRSPNEEMSLQWMLARGGLLLPRGFLPFAYTSCGDHLVVDAIASPHAVYFSDHEDGDRLTPIASSFDGFIDGLRRPN